MEITIKRYSRKMTYEDAATLDEFWELAKRTERSLDREQRRHWDGRECDEYIIAAQGLLPYCATPEELAELGCSGAGVGDMGRQKTTIFANLGRGCRCED